MRNNRERAVTIMALLSVVPAERICKGCLRNLQSCTEETVTNVGKITS